MPVGACPLLSHDQEWGTNTALTSRSARAKASVTPAGAGDDAKLKWPRSSKREAPSAAPLPPREDGSNTFGPASCKSSASCSAWPSMARAACAAAAAAVSVAVSTTVRARSWVFKCDGGWKKVVSPRTASTSATT